MSPPEVSQNARDPAFVQDPYPFYARLHAMGGRALWAEYGFPVLAGFDDVSALLRDRRFGREDPAPPERPAHLAPFYAFEANSMLERDGAAHARLRGLVNRAFVARRVEALRPRIEALAHRLIDEIRPGDDLLTGFCEPIPVTVIAELLGVPPEAAPELLRWSHDMVAMYQFRRDRAVEEAATAATLEFSAFIREHVGRRRAAPGDDLVSALIAAEERGDKLAEEELVATCILLLNAGHEASVHAICNAIAAILRSGFDPAALLATPGAAARTVEEALRFDPPLHMFTRFALEDVELGGLSLRRGETVGLLLGAAARDPARFADPGRFDPGRADCAHVSFGAGPHFCVGAPLARLEAQAALPILFARLPRLALAETPVVADRYHFHGFERLAATWGGAHRPDAPS